MAIDSQNRRRSALASGFPATLLAVPDDDIEREDRAGLYVYSGLTPRAVDTEDKRRSALLFKGTLRVHPVAKGVISARDRAHMWLYRGIDIGAAAPATLTIQPMIGVDDSIFL